MRVIPSELLERVKKKWQVPAENAEPAMKVYLSRGFINELFQVFTIQEGAELTDVDVTVKRTDTSAEPAEAYALAINDGVAHVMSKPLPYDDQIPWVDRMTVALSATAVAIEFDGYWDRDYATRRFNFVTEEYPWLFYVQGGTLYAKYWEDAEITLATDVAKVCAIRGWLPANGDQSNDQGLIVAYIKTDGLVYYRSYCIQVGGGKLWEVERNVAEVMTAAADLALFRTNDFRIGFMISTGGVMYWLLTARNWAGMSIWPEVLQVGVSDVHIDLFDPTYIDAPSPDEILTVSAAPRSMELCDLSIPDPEVVDFTRVDGNTFKLKFNFLLLNRTGTAAAWRDVIGENDFAVVSAEPGENDDEMVIVTQTTYNGSQDVTIRYTGLSNLRTYANDECRRFVPSFDHTDKGVTPFAYETEVLQVSAYPLMGYYDLTDTKGYTDGDVLNVSVSAVVIVLMDLSGNPV
ncbi:hypothetical protein [Acidaminobacter sp.]|uniref:hypothetical protein n=1 Tax=Acidaminobacter sp. TaxID=1872102 RepID=UPI00256B0FC2|nr:hypothetical protein [Acidaminobacter sp.]MDK9712307.1 hypothetical protein [Acidaminobacter sp.]